MLKRSHVIISLIVSVFICLSASAQVPLPPSYNSNAAGYGPAAAQFFSACTPVDPDTGAPLAGHVSWIWSAGGGAPVYCLALTDQSRIGGAGSAGAGYAVGDVITLSAANGGTTEPAKLVVTGVSSTGGAVTSFTFRQSAGGFGGIFYPPHPTSFVQSSTSGAGAGFALAAPNFDVPVVTNPVPNVNSGGYWPNYFDNGLLSHCDLQCWQLTHPDWIAYDCDQKTPAFYQRVTINNVSAVNGTTALTMAPSDAALLTTGWGAITKSDGVFVGKITRINAKTGVVMLDTPFADPTGQYSIAFANVKHVPLNFTDPGVQSYVASWLTSYVSGGTGHNPGKGDGDGNGHGHGHGHHGHGHAYGDSHDPPEQLGAGFGSVDIDLVNPNNTNGVCGYYAGATPTGGTAPSFGGTWTPLFSGTGAAIDLAFTTAETGYVCGLTTAVHGASHAAFVAGNVSGASNGSIPSSSMQPLLACLDVWADEASFFSCKNGASSVKVLTGTPFDQAFSTVQSGQSSRVWASVSYLCQSVGTSAVSLTPFQAAGEAWASAVFYLLQADPGTQPTYQGMIGFAKPQPIDHARYVPYDPSWFPNIGTPLEQGHVNAGGCYERHYSAGLVELNTGSSVCTFAVPTNAKDQFGAAVTTGVLQPVPADRTKIACSTPTQPGSACSALVMTTQ